MPTNRTASGKWRAFRRRMQSRAIRAGTYRCVKCYRPLDADAKPGTEGHGNLDHIVRVHDGGGEYDQANVQWLCEPCHLLKTAAENSTKNPRPFQQLPRDIEVPREGRWYPNATVGALNREGFVVGWFADQRLWLGGRWHTEAEAIAQQKAAGAKGKPNPLFHR